MSGTLPYAKYLLIRCGACKVNPLTEATSASFLYRPWVACMHQDRLTVTVTTIPYPVRLSQIPKSFSLRNVTSSALTVMFTRSS